MGVFDSVFIPCPDCGKEVEFQSRAGPCQLNRYRGITSAPKIIQVDILGHTERCECGAGMEIRGDFIVIAQAVKVNVATAPDDD